MARLPDKYRPDTLDEIVGQDHVIPALKRIVARAQAEGGVPPHCLFIGPPGCGKTSAGIAMAKVLWDDKWAHHFKEFNASDARKIDDVRTRYKVLSQHKGDRMLLLDEADRMTKDAQHAMRRIMEKTKSTCFILTGNSKDNILDAIESRCVTFVFKRLDDKIVLKQILKICQAEGIGFEDKQARAGLVQLARNSRGDLRSAMNNLTKIIGEQKSITVENVMLLQKPETASLALIRAIEGDSLAAREIIENAYIESGFSYSSIIDVLWEALPGVTSEEVRNRLYRELAVTQARCAIVSNPLIQLIGFIMYAWIAPRLQRCPALEDER